MNRDSPRGPVVKNPPANAGNMSSIPGPGRSHMLRSNSAHAPQLWSLCAQSHALQREGATMRSPCTETRAARRGQPRAPKPEQPPTTATREGPQAAVKTQLSHKETDFKANKRNNKKSIFAVPSPSHFLKKNLLKYS